MRVRLTRMRAWLHGTGGRVLRIILSHVLLMIVLVLIGPQIVAIWRILLYGPAFDQACILLALILIGLVLDAKRRVGSILHDSGKEPVNDEQEHGRGSSQGSRRTKNR